MVKRFVLAALLSSFILSLSAFGQVSPDATFNDRPPDSTGITTFDLPVTVGAGSNRLLLASRASRNNDNESDADFGDQNMFPADVNGTDAAGSHAAIFSLENPDVEGPTNLNYDFSATSVGFVVCAISATNAEQTPTVVASKGSGFTSATNGIGDSLTGLSGGELIMSTLVLRDNSSPAISDEAEDFTIFEGVLLDTGSSRRAICSYRIADTATETVDWTWTGTQNGAYAMAAYAPAVSFIAPKVLEILSRMGAFFPSLQFIWGMP